MAWSWRFHLGSNAKAAKHLISWWWFAVVLSAVVLGVAIGVLAGRL